jgi:protein-S-isoprenylcysteine O-methyltransferase Ste14
MAVLYLVVFAAWLLAVSVVRGVVTYRRTGAMPARLRHAPGSPQWWSGVSATVGFVFAVAAPFGDRVGLDPIGALDDAGVAVTGVVLVVLGVVLTVASQVAMGASWRVDVDSDVRTALVETGPFRWVRNPIFSGSALAGAGLALIVPNVFSLGMLVFWAAAWQLQVRMVEEPYLARVHGRAYEDYAGRTGRFVPWIGRRWTT